MSDPYTQIIGMTFDKVVRAKITYVSEHEGIAFYVNGKPIFALYHTQECCEEVNLEDICGDLSDLENSPILVFEKAVSEGPADYSDTWTFIKISTIKGSVTIRFYGTSNGYYSEDADLQFITEIDYVEEIEHIEGT